MKRITYILLLIFLFVGNIPKVSASHMMSAELGWTNVGQDSFLIKLTLYGDCNGVTPSYCTIDLFEELSGSFLFINSIGVSLGIPVDITPVCNSICSRCKSSSCSFPYGIKRYNTQALVVLSGMGYNCRIKVSLTQNARTGAITTGAAARGFYTEAIFDHCISSGSSSPQFTSDPIKILCVGKDFSWESAAKYNTTGIKDSFTYHWAKPLDAANSTISYIGSYAYDNAIFFWGFPNNALAAPRGLHLDTLTGEIFFRPMKAEVTVMVVGIMQFRNGVKIGEIRREIEIIVIACPNNNPPLITTSGNIRSKNVCLGDTVFFKFSTSDPDTNDTIKISWNKANQGAIWSDSNGLSKHPSATLTWVPTVKDVRSQPYTFSVYALDNGCPISSLIVQKYQITVYHTLKANISISDSGCGIIWFRAKRIIGSGPTYSWQGKSFSFSPNIDSVVQHKFQPGIYPFSMKMTTNGCSTTYYDTVRIIGDSLASVKLPADTAICKGSTVSIIPQINFYKGALKYKWSTGNTNKTQNIGPLFSNKSLSLIVEDTNGCLATDDIIISVLINPDITRENPIEICYRGNYIVIIKPVYQLFGSKNSVKSFNWHRLYDTTTLSQLAELNTKDTGQFVFTIKDKYGCSASESFSILNSIKRPKLTLKDIDICYNHNTMYPAKVIPVYQVFGSSNYISLFNWSMVGNPKILSSLPELITKDTGMFVLKIADKFGCSALDTFSILNSIKRPEIKMDERAFLCYNTIINFKIIPYYSTFGSNNYIRDFKWLHSGDTTILSTTNLLTVKDTGIYYFIITDQFGCADTGIIHVEQTKQIDTSLQINDSILTASLGMKRYDWYKNDTLISSSNSNMFFTNDNGRYYVLLTDSNNCNDKSSTIVINLNQISDQQFNNSIKLYPNPTTGKLILEIKEPLNRNINLIITDIYGREIMNQMLYADDIQTTKEVDISNQPAGIYTVIIRDQNSNFHQLIIKE